MKPLCQSDSTRPGAKTRSVRPRFPFTDYFYQSRIEEWRGFSSPYDGRDRDRFRNLHRLRREYYGAAAREYLREVIAFAVVVAASAWPVVYMVIVVVRLLSKEHP
jgi:hypothetical protein